MSVGGTRICLISSYLDPHLRKKNLGSVPDPNHSQGMLKFSTRLDGVKIAPKKLSDDIFPPLNSIFSPLFVIIPLSFFFFRLIKDMRGKHLFLQAV